jgi:surface antigen
MSTSERRPRKALVGLAGIVIIAVGLAGWMLYLGHSPQAFLAAGPGNDYPWGNATDCSQTFGIYSWCLNGNWLSPLGFGYRNCTDYAAYELNEAMGGSVSHPKFAWKDINVKTPASPNGDGNAREWKQGAINRYGAGVANGTPAVGAVAWWGTVGHGFGHVGIVTSVSPDRQTIRVDSYNEDQHGNFYPDTISTTKRGVLPWPDAFLHIADGPSASGSSADRQPADFAGKIVQWDGDHNQQRASWLVSADLKRYWIPDIRTYWCLRGQGHADAGPISEHLLDQLPDTGHWATCGSSPIATAPVAVVLTPTPTPPPTSPPPAPSHPVDAYSNYGQDNLVGHAMCRGNPGDPLSMPGGTGTQTFTVPAGVSTLSSAMVQVDPADVTAYLTVYVNGVAQATAAAAAVGDTHFTFGPVSVHQGDTVMLSITFTATYGKIITLYTVGHPGGTFTAQNSCPDGAPSVTVTDGGLRAVVSGMS